MQYFASVRVRVVIIKINLVRNRKIWHPLFGDLKLVLQKMPERYMLILRGNPDITIILFGMMNHYIESEITSKIILQYGRRISFMNDNKTKSASSKGSNWLVL